MKKRIISLALSAITAVSFVTACPFAVSAEESYSYKDLPIYEEIYEVTLKNLDEYMSLSTFQFERFDDETNDKFVNSFISRKNLCVPENDLPLKVYFQQSDKSTRPYLWPAEIDPYAVKVEFTYSENTTDEDINNYIKDNYKDCKFPEVRYWDWNLKSYCTTDEEAAVIDKINIKAIVTDLYEKGFIESADLSYGTTYGRGMYRQYGRAVSALYPTEGIDGISEDIITTKQDILEWRAKGTIDCNFGILVHYLYMPENIDYINYGEIDNKIDYDFIYYPGNYCYVPISPESAMNVDEKLLEVMDCFVAFPDEFTLENHIDLMYRITQEIPVNTGIIGGTDIGTSLVVNGITIDVLNAVDGDANCDDILSIADAAAVLQSIGNPDKYALSIKGSFNAECEGENDGITVSDALFIQKKLAKVK